MWSKGLEDGPMPTYTWYNNNNKHSQMKMNGEKKGQLKRFH